MSSPAGGVGRFSYDPNGNLLTKTDAHPVTPTHTYDELNRPTQTTYAGGAVSTPAVSRCYDGLTCNGGPCTGTHPPGKRGALTAFGSTVSAATFDPDVLGRVVASSEIIDDPSQPGSALSYTFA